MSPIEDKTVQENTEAFVARQRSCLTSPVGSLPDSRPVEQRDEGPPQGTKYTATSPIGIAAPVNWTPLAGNKPRRTKIINMVGSFPNPWKNLDEEIKQIKAGQSSPTVHWSPTVDDFEAVATSNRKNESVVECPSFSQFLGAIYLSPLGSVKRVNVFTHGSTAEIAFSGTVSRATGDVFFSGASLTDASLADASDPTRYFQIELPNGKLSKPFFLKDVLKRFAGDARIVLYACRSGVDTAFLQNIADTFKVTAMGFSKPIAYCPKYSARGIDRRRIAVGSCSKGATRDYTTLSPDRRATPKP